MDIRGIIAGGLSLVALIGLIVLQGIGKLDAGAAGILSSIASGGMTYALGLYSSAYDAPVGVGSRDGESGRVDALGVAVIAYVIAMMGTITAGILSVIL